MEGNLEVPIYPVARGGAPGKRYHLTLFDSTLNSRVAEEIADHSGYQTVDTFLKGSLHGKPLVAITTDHTNGRIRIYSIAVKSAPQAL
jgi:hypothetical protein